MYTLCHSYIFRHCFNFCHSTTLSHQKRVLKHPINMTPNSGFVRSADFLPYTCIPLCVCCVCVVLTHVLCLSKCPVSALCPGSVSASVCGGWHAQCRRLAPEAEPGPARSRDQCSSSREDQPCCTARPCLSLLALLLLLL